MAILDGDPGGRDRFRSRGSSCRTLSRATQRVVVIIDFGRDTGIYSLPLLAGLFLQEWSDWIYPDENNLGALGVFLLSFGF